MVFLTSIVPHENRYRHYLIERENNLVNVKRGRMGFQFSQLKSFASESEAVKWIEKMVNRKIRKGYSKKVYCQLSLF